jgi:hypothetical protein
MNVWIERLCWRLSGAHKDSVRGVRWLGTSARLVTFSSERVGDGWRNSLLLTDIRNRASAPFREVSSVRADLLWSTQLTDHTVRSSCALYHLCHAHAMTQLKTLTKGVDSIEMNRVCTACCAQPSISPDLQSPFADCGGWRHTHSKRSVPSAGGHRERADAGHSGEPNRPPRACVAARCAVRDMGGEAWQPTSLRKFLVVS